MSSYTKLVKSFVTKKKPIGEKPILKKMDLEKDSDLFNSLDLGQYDLVHNIVMNETKQNSEHMVFVIYLIKHIFEPINQEIYTILKIYQENPVPLSNPELLESVSPYIKNFILKFNWSKQHLRDFIRERIIYYNNFTSNSAIIDKIYKLKEDNILNIKKMKLTNSIINILYNYKSSQNTEFIKNINDFNYLKPFSHQKSKIKIINTIEYIYNLIYEWEYNEPQQTYIIKQTTGYTIHNNLFNNYIESYNMHTLSKIDKSFNYIGNDNKFDINIDDLYNFKTINYKGLYYINTKINVIKKLKKKYNRQIIDRTLDQHENINLSYSLELSVTNKADRNDNNENILKYLNYLLIELFIVSIKNIDTRTILDNIFKDSFDLDNFSTVRTSNEEFDRIIDQFKNYDLHEQYSKLIELRKNMNKKFRDEFAILTQLFLSKETLSDNTILMDQHIRTHYGQLIDTMKNIVYYKYMQIFLNKLINKYNPIVAMFYNDQQKAVTDQNPVIKEKYIFFNAIYSTDPQTDKKVFLHTLRKIINYKKLTINTRDKNSEVNSYLKNISKSIESMEMNIDNLFPKNISEVHTQAINTGAAASGVGITRTVDSMFALFSMPPPPPSQAQTQAQAPSLPPRASTGLTGFKTYDSQPETAPLPPQAPRATLSPLQRRTRKTSTREKSTLPSLTGGIKTIKLFK